MIGGKVQKILQQWQEKRNTIIGLVVVFAIAGIYFLFQVPQSINVSMEYNTFISTMNIASAEVEILREGYPVQKMDISDQSLLMFLWEMVRKGTYPPRLGKNYDNVYFDIKIFQKNGDVYFLKVTYLPSNSILDCAFSDSHGGAINFSYEDRNKYFISFFGKFLRNDLIP